MATLLDALNRRFDEEIIRLLSAQIGASEEDTRGGVAVALPLLISALTAEARDHVPEALDAALAKDHDGTVFDHLDAILERSARGTSLMDAEPWLMERMDFDHAAVDGDGILGHVLGARRERIALGISRVTALQAETVNELLAVLAPIVMSAVGKVKQDRGLDAEGLRALLSAEHHRLQGALADQVEGETPPLLKFMDVSDEEVIRATTEIGAALRETPLVKQLLTHTPT